jgi:hypothetical protein
MDSIEPIVTPPPQPPVSEGSWNPSRYYAQPPAGLEKGRSAIFGCGAASLVILLLLFLAGSFFASGGLRMLLGYAVGEIAARIDPKTTPDLSPAERADLKNELDRAAKMSRSASVPLPKLVPLLEKMQTALADEKITKDEARELVQAVQQLNRPAGPPR